MQHQTNFVKGALRGATAAFARASEHFRAHTQGPPCAIFILARFAQIRLVEYSRAWPEQVAPTSMHGPRLSVLVVHGPKCTGPGLNSFSKAAKEDLQVKRHTCPRDL
jgi:hypothetical protein